MELEWNRQVSVRFWLDKFFGETVLNFDLTLI